MRCIEVRQKMNLAFNETNVKYDKKLTQKIFLRSVEESIQSVFTIQEVKYLLMQESLSDVDLLSAITKAASYESDIYMYILYGYIYRYILLRKNQDHEQKCPSGKVREVVARYQNDTNSKIISS